MQNYSMSRRRFLTVAGSTVILAGLGGLVGCSSNSNSGSGDNAAATTETKALAGSITAVGSTALQPLVEAAAEKFQAENPGVTITVQGGGSGQGITQIVQGAVQIGNSDVFAEEKLDNKSDAEKLTDNKVCVVGMGPVVNSEVSIDDIKMDDLKKIFTGEITNWKEVGGADEPIIVIGREAGSGTRGAFEELVDLVDGCKYANELDSTGAVIAKVASTPGAIGYASLDALDDSVKALSLEGVEATAENIKAGNYFLSRPFVMATKGEISEQNDLVQAWFDFVLGDEGQQVASEVGLITVK